MHGQAAIHNLRLLLARATTLGSPTSKNFCTDLREGGASIKETQLSRWLMGDEPLMSWDAREIERAASVPSGWLDEDLGFIFRAAPALLKAFRNLAELPADQQVAFEKLLETLPGEHLRVQTQS